MPGLSGLLAIQAPFACMFSRKEVRSGFAMLYGRLVWYREKEGVKL